MIHISIKALFIIIPFGYEGALVFWGFVKDNNP
jgi:hypothetical protein